MGQAIEKTIKAIECRFAKHISRRRDGEPDVHLVKEVVHYSDNTSERRIKLLSGVKRPFYITNQRFRNHKQKKVYEKLEHVDEYWCTQDNLTKEIAIKLGETRGYKSQFELSASPYLYGSDFPSSAYIMAKYKEKYPNNFTPSEVAILDIETNMMSATPDMPEVLMVIVTNGKWAQLSLDASYYKHIPNAKQLLTEAINTYLGGHIEERGMFLEVIWCEDEIETIGVAFDKLHKEKPDIVGIWNMAFDIPIILGRLKVHGIDPAQFLSDPGINPALRRCYWKPGKENRVTEKGNSKSIDFFERWHEFFLTASFQCIDQMCTYFQLRLGSQKEANYKLNTIMDKWVQLKKLNFRQAEEANVEDGTPQWHIFMQTYYRIEYAVYCIFDGIGPIILDEKLGDLRRTLPYRARNTDLSNFDSQAVKNATRLYGVCKDHGLVVGTLGPAESRQPSDVLSRLGFIVTLSSYLITDEGLCILSDNPSQATGLYAMNGDDDCISSYPSDITACNIATNTTANEIVTIKGIPEAVFRHNNINLSSGPVNAIEYSTSMFGLPDYRAVMKAAEKLLR